MQLCICQAITGAQTLSHAPHASQVPTGALVLQPPQLPDHRTRPSWRQMPPPGQPQELGVAQSRGAFDSEGFHAPSAGIQLVQVHASERFRVGHRSRPQPRPIAQFSYFGAVSVYNVPKCADHLMVETDCTLSTTARSCFEFQHAVCAPLGLLPRDVCWFINFPHSLPSYSSISMTVTGRSPECLLSHSLNWWLMPMESMMLNQQYEMLRAALDPTWQAPVHSYKMPKIMSVPELPHDDLMAKLFLMWCE